MTTLEARRKRDSQERVLPMLDVMPTERRRQIVARMVSQGKSTAFIANRLQVPVSVIRTDRLMLSVPNPQEVRKVSPENPSVTQQLKYVSYHSTMETAVRRAMVAKLHADGLTGSEIALRLRTTAMNVSRDREYLNLKAVDTSAMEKRRASVKELSEKDVPYREIAKMLNVSRMTVLRDRKALGIEVTQEAKDDRISERRAKVEELAKTGMEYKKIARELDLSPMTVLRDCEALGIKSPKSHDMKDSTTAERRESIRKLLATKTSITDIAKELDISHMTVRRDIKAMSV